MKYSYRRLLGQRLTTIAEWVSGDLRYDRGVQR